MQVKQHWKGDRAGTPRPNAHICHGNWPHSGQGQCVTTRLEEGQRGGLGVKDSRAPTATPSISSCWRAVCPRLAHCHRRPIAPTSSPETKLRFSPLGPVPALRLCTPLGCDFCLHPATEPSGGALTGLETVGQGRVLNGRGGGGASRPCAQWHQREVRTPRGGWAQEGGRAAQLCPVTPGKAQVQERSPTTESHGSDPGLS